jgi:primary-amine oxidase
VSGNCNMTTIEDRTAAAGEQTQVTHPLDRLQAHEMAEAVAAVKAHPSFGDRMRFVTVALQEPAKAVVLAFEPGDAVDRHCEIILLDNADGSTHEITVSVSEGEVTSWSRRTDVQPSVMVDEFLEAEQAIREDPRFVAAMALRGLTDMSLVCVDPWSAGNYGDPLESGQRIIRALIWVRAEAGDNHYAHPVDGVSVLLDLNEMTVLRVDDDGVVPIPAPKGNYTRAYITETRNGIKPLEIVQSDGPSFTLEGDRLRWQNWDLRVGWNPREGLVLNTVSFTEGGTARPVLYRASLAEMTVPYGDPSSTQARKNAFDVGEYGVGMLANSLKLGCDCLGEIRYLDASMCMSNGDVVTIENAICIHEEDHGISWKHMDFRTEETEVRRLRRLVVSFIATVGNYEYGSYWYFYQDGRIELEIKLTGILSTAAAPAEAEVKYGTRLNDVLYAANHQHFFCIRLDTQIDGVRNSVVEVNTRPAPAEENPWGNAFYGESTVLATEQAAQRVIDPMTGRFWKIQSSERTNKTGRPTAYKLIPGENIVPFATESSSIRQRAAYMWNHLWVTPYDRNERYPAGEYPNQHAGGAGLPEWTAADRPVEDTDVVVWYVMGHNHLPALEDWPVMPVASMGFTLKPSGFFDQSPVMDLPPSNGCH